MGWADVTGWVAQGGAILGTKRTLPKARMAQVAARLAEFKVHGLLIIGGFEVSFIIADWHSAEYQATLCSNNRFSMSEYIIHLITCAWPLVTIN